MGVQNRITEDKYAKIKPFLRTPKDDAKVVKRFKISETTARSIRNTKNYAEYCERVFRYHGNPRKRGQILYRPPVDEMLPDVDWDEGEDPMKSMKLMVLAITVPISIVALIALIVAFMSLAGGE